MKPTFLVDLDEVCCDCIGPWLRWYNRECGSSLTKADVVSWEWDDFLPQCDVNIYDWVKIPGVFRNLDRFPGVYSTLSTFRDDFNFVACTSRGDMHRTDTLNWIDEYLPLFDSVVFAQHKHRVPASFILDDKPNTLFNCQAYGMVTVCMDQPYNIHVPGLRAVDWSEVYLIMEDLIYERGRGRVLA